MLAAACTVDCPVCGCPLTSSFEGPQTGQSTVHAAGYRLGPRDWRPWLYCKCFGFRRVARAGFALWRPVPHSFTTSSSK